MGGILLFSKLFNYLKKESATHKTYVVNDGQSQSTDFSQRKNQIEGYTLNAIVFRCVDMIATGVAKVPLVLHLNGKIVEKHPLLDLLNKPNSMQSKSEFILDVISQKLITGNAYIEAAFPGASPDLNVGKPSYLYSLDPAKMEIVPGKNGIPSEYKYTKNGISVNFPVSVIGLSNILHIKSFNPTNHWYGLSPMQPSGSSVDQVNSGNRWNNSLLKNGGKPSGVLQTDQKLTNEQYENMKKYREDNIQGTMNTGKTLVLEGGLNFKPMSMSPTDLDFIEGIKSATQTIGFAFGVPYDLLNTAQAKYDNLAMAYEMLWDQSIEPNLTHLIDELNTWLVPKYGSELVLSYDKDQVEAIASKRDRKRKSLDQVTFMTINEKRSSMGLEGAEGGDILLTEMNKIPLSEAGFTFDDNTDDQKKSSYIKSMMSTGHDRKQAEKLADIVFEDGEE